MNASAQPVYREVVDDNGRVYRIGETDRDILGRSRAWMVWLPWIAMMAISSSEYAFTSAEDTLSTRTTGGTGPHLLVARRMGVLPGRGGVPGRPVAGKWQVVGALGDDARCRRLASGLSVAGDSPNVFFAYLGFGFFGGAAAGFVYATCVNMVGKWYPERKGGKTGFVNGGFAYGSVPFIFLFT